VAIDPELRASVRVAFARQNPVATYRAEPRLEPVFEMNLAKQAIQERQASP